MADQLNKLAEDFRAHSLVVDDAEARKEIRLEAQRLSVDHHFSPRSLMEWRAETFGLWCVTYIPHLIPHVEDWQVPTLDDFFKYGRILIMWPAGLGKSTTFSVATPLFRTIRDPNLEGIKIFKDDSEAKGFLQTIKNEMTENELLIRDYGQLKPNNSDRTKKWTQHAIDFAQRTRRSPRPNLHFLPYGAKVLGKRSHWRGADDIVTRQIAMSQLENQKQIDYFQVDFESGPYAPDDPSYISEQDQITVEMTRMTGEDLAHHLETRVPELEEGVATEIRPFHTHCVDLLDEVNMRTVSPRWTWAKAKAKEAEMGIQAFSMRYRNKVQTDKTALFKRVYFDGGVFDDTEYSGCYNRKLTFEDALEKGMKVFIGYDPQSGSQTRHAAEAGLVMLGNKADGTWTPRLLDFARAKCEILGDKDPDSQVMRILAMARRCNSLGITPRCILESNNVQRALRSGILDAASRHGVEITCTLSPTGDDKWDPETGIETTVIDFENGWLEIPAMTAHDRAYFKPFVEAMIGYGASAFIDVPIAYWKARKYLYQSRGQNTQRQQVITVTPATPPRVRYRLGRLGWTNGLVIRDAYAAQEEEIAHGQRV